jgi:HSP20 family protein
MSTVFISTPSTSGGPSFFPQENSSGFGSSSHQPEFQSDPRLGLFGRGGLDFGGGRGGFFGGGFRGGFERGRGGVSGFGGHGGFQGRFTGCGGFEIGSGGERGRGGNFRGRGGSSGFPKSSFEREGWTPSVELSEDKYRVLVRAVLPGLKKEEIKIEVVDGILTIVGVRTERRLGVPEQGESYSLGTFAKSFRLLEVNWESLKATYNEVGTLEISILKQEKKEEGSRVIQINVEEQDQDQEKKGKEKDENKSRKPE